MAEIRTGTTNLIEGTCKFVTLDNGVELAFCEFGEENEEVVVSGAFYFHTFNIFLKELAKKYHVYGFLCRMGGYGDQLNEDGTVNWAKQWAADIYEATQKLGLTKYNFVGKCHGVIPGWGILKEHPEVVNAVVSISQSVHVCEQDADQWTELQKTEGPNFTLRTLKKHKLLALKAKEAQAAHTTGTVGENAVDPKLGYYGSHAEALFDSYDAVKEWLSQLKTPVCYIFATDDILYNDFKTANEAAVYMTPGARTVFLQGERHLLEMDMPIRLAREVTFFIEGTKLAYE